MCPNQIDRGVSTGTQERLRTYRVAGRQSDADHVAVQCAARWPKMQSLCLDEAKGQAQPR
jgi:hypothetical protein